MARICAPSQPPSVPYYTGSVENSRDGEGGFTEQRRSRVCALSLLYSFIISALLLYLLVRFYWQLYMPGPFSKRRSE